MSDSESLELYRQTLLRWFARINESGDLDLDSRNIQAVLLVRIGRLKEALGYVAKIRRTSNRHYWLTEVTKSYWQFLPDPQKALVRTDDAIGIMVLADCEPEARSWCRSTYNKKYRWNRFLHLYMLTRKPEDILAARVALKGLKYHLDDWQEIKLGFAKTGLEEDVRNARIFGQKRLAGDSDVVEYFLDLYEISGEKEDLETAKAFYNKHCKEWTLRNTSYEERIAKLSKDQGALDKLAFERKLRLEKFSELISYIRKTGDGDCLETAMNRLANESDLCTKLGQIYDLVGAIDWLLKKDQEDD